MKSIFFFCISVLFLNSCHQQVSNQTTTFINDSLPEGSLADISDFDSTAPVDNVNEVNFFVYTKLDSVTLYTQPQAQAKSLRIVNDRFNNYYGFEDLGDFFKLHYQIKNNPPTTIVAYVSKQEFTKDSQLSLQGIDLNVIRSSAQNGVDDHTTKSFSKLGTISLIDEATYLQAKKQTNTEPLIPNPEMKFDGSAWSLSSSGAKDFQVVKYLVGAEENTEYTYRGRSSTINREIFLEQDHMSGMDHYVGYDPDAPDETPTYFSSPPIILPTHGLVATIRTNTDQMTDFVLTGYDHQANTLTILLYANFTNFKVPDTSSLFWVDSRTLYFKATHSNTRISDPTYKSEYLKLQLSTAID